MWFSCTSRMTSRTRADARESPRSGQKFHAAAIRGHDSTSAAPSATPATRVRKRLNIRATVGIGNAL